MYLLGYQVLKSIGDTLVIVCDEIIYVMYIASTKKVNTVAANMSINYYDKKVKYKIDCYILHTVLFAIIFLVITTIIWYHYARKIQKRIEVLAISDGK